MQRDTTPHNPENDDTEFEDIPSSTPTTPTTPKNTYKKPASHEVEKGPATRKESLTAGDELEVRLARMQFYKGAYTRRGVNLERHFHPDPLLVTDLDLLSFDVTTRLTLSKTIGEAKSGTGKSASKPLDRAIWMAGLMRLVEAEGGIVVTGIRPSSRVRETVRSLGVTAIGIEDIDRWEKVHLPPTLSDIGAQGPGAFAADIHARATAKGEPRLERIYWFLRSEVWFLDNWQATKRLVGALGELRHFWTPEIDDAQSGALRWMYAESISILTLQLVALVGRLQASNTRDWHTLVNDRLAEGAISISNQRALSSAFDKYLGHILGELRAPSTLQVESMGAFHPSPPEWAYELLQLLTRIEELPGLADLPRHTDLLITERLVRRRHASEEALLSVSPRDPAEFALIRRQIAAFLRGAAHLPDPVDRALIS